MLPAFPEWIPYTFIGKAVVALVALIAALIVVGVVVSACLFVWIRGFAWISNRMYDGYNIKDADERPPRWKVRIAGVTLALSRFKFRKIPAAYREADEIANGDETMVNYLETVFINRESDS